MIRTPNNGSDSSLSSPQELIPVFQLNALENTVAFFSIVNVLFETAAPLASLLWKNRPFESYDALIDFAEDACLRNSEGLLSRDDLLQIINAHPRLGAPKKQLSEFSRKEQGYEKIATDDDSVNAELMRLNVEYEDRFGFKFVEFVNGRPRRDLIPVIQMRMKRTADEELRTGLKGMMDIARDRLKKL